MYATNDVLRGLKLLQEDARDDHENTRLEINRAIDKLHEMLEQACTAQSEYLTWMADRAAQQKPVRIDEHHLHPETPEAIVRAYRNIFDRLKEYFTSRYYSTRANTTNLWWHVSELIKEYELKLTEARTDKYAYTVDALTGWQKDTISHHAAKQLGLNPAHLAAGVARANRAS